MLKTSSGLPPLDQYSGIERIILSTNGNLQKVISAYYQKSVHVFIHKLEHQPFKHNHFQQKRFVELQLETDHQNKIPFAIAFSSVSLTDKSHYDFFVQQNPGLGQFFFNYQILPNFELLGYGRCFDFHQTEMIQCNFEQKENLDTFLNWIKDQSEYCSQMSWLWKKGNFWRFYRLESAQNGVSCFILEIFRNEIFHLIDNK